ncbi:MAG: YbbR-like domain-containing protein [Acidobacteria bacterium]|nr:YbbR-like domain-containing protein [Acidobacteriota bacterium]
MSPNIKEKLLENWILKITAIFLAGILWLFIQELETDKTVTAPVKVQGVPAGMEISSGLPSTVQVRFRGADQTLACNIDLRDAREGENRITLTRDHIETQQGFGMEVFQVNPSQVTLMLEKTISKPVPITIPVQGEVADGFEIYDKIPSSRVVEITGPRSHIESIGEVPTDIIDISDLDQDSNFQVSLNFEDGAIRSSITDPIWVELRIGPRRNEYYINKVPLVMENESYVSSPKQIDIHVMAPEDLQPDLVPGNFSAIIRTQNLDPSALPAKVKPAINYREDWKGKIKQMGTRPPEVTVRKKDEQSSKQ